MPHTAIRTIDQSQLVKEWNERIFGPRLAAAHHPRPPAPVGLTAEEFRGLTEALGTARSSEEFLQSAQRMSITVRKTLEKTFALTLVDPHRVMSRVAEVGIPSILQTLLSMQAEGSITLEASPNVRLNKVQRTAQYTPANTIGGSRFNLSLSAAGAGGVTPHATAPSVWGIPVTGAPPAYTAPPPGHPTTPTHIFGAGRWGTPAGWRFNGGVGGGSYGVGSGAMPDRGCGTGGPPPSLGTGKQVAPVASVLTSLLTGTNRMMKKLDEQGSRSKGDKSSGTLSDSQSAEKRL